MKNNEKLLDLIGEADESMIPEIKIKNNEAYLMNQEEDEDMKENASVFIVNDRKKNRKFNWSALGGGLCAAAVLGFAIFGGWKVYEINNDINNSSTDAPDITDNSQGSGNAITPDPSVSQTEDVSKPEPDAVYPPVLDSGAVYERYGGGELDEILTLGYCCVIPYGTPIDEIEESIQRLYPYSTTVVPAGYQNWPGLGMGVVSASSTYSVNGEVIAQSLHLDAVRGSVTLSGKAVYDNMTHSAVWIELDEESLKKLPVLNPKYFADDYTPGESDYVNEPVYFAVREATNYYFQIKEFLETNGEANITISTDNFTISYTNAHGLIIEGLEFGSETDGYTIGEFDTMDNILDLTIE